MTEQTTHNSLKRQQLNEIGLLPALAGTGALAWGASKLFGGRKKAESNPSNPEQQPGNQQQLLQYLEQYRQQQLAQYYQQLYPLQNYSSSAGMDPAMMAYLMNQNSGTGGTSGGMDPVMMAYLLSGYGY